MPLFYTRYTEEQSAEVRNAMRRNLYTAGVPLPSPASLGLEHNGSSDENFRNYAAALGVPVATANGSLHLDCGDSTDYDISRGNTSYLMWSDEERAEYLNPSANPRRTLRLWPNGVNPLTYRCGGDPLPIPFEVGVPIGWRRLDNNETTCILDMIVYPLEGRACFAAHGSGAAEGMAVSDTLNGAVFFRHPLVPDDLAGVVRCWCRSTYRAVNNGLDLEFSRGAHARLGELPLELFKRLPFLQFDSWLVSYEHSLGGPAAPRYTSSRPRVALPKSIHSIPLPLP